MSEPVKKVRGRPFTGKDDPRRVNGAPKKHERVVTELDKITSKEEALTLLVTSAKCGNEKSILRLVEYYFGAPVQQVDQNITSIDKGATFRFEIIECQLQSAESKPTSSDHSQGQ